ncbi:unnamed protein product [Polarella glacialis]|uniref:Uncharacterized protein n=1 Tax=Polarella glacialis TaxID=89957 RepID=A0A813GZ47_POLGL|nr:unnamed protein product [Polarella glacialis]
MVLASNEWADKAIEWADKARQSNVTASITEWADKAIEWADKEWLIRLGLSRHPPAWRAGFRRARLTGRMIPIIAFGILANNCLVALSTWAVPKPPFSFHKGNWTYEPELHGVRQFGRFFYNSPMGKNCVNKLTIFTMASRMCGPGYVSEEYVVGNFSTCRPDEMEAEACLVDGINSDLSVLQDTCLQLVTTQYPYKLEAPFGGREGNLMEAFAQLPIQGVVGFQQLAKLAGAATSMKVPFIEVGSSANVLDDFSDQGKYQTTFRLRTDTSWNFPGILKKLLSDKFALLLEDTTASDMSPFIARAAAEHNKTIALVEVIPSNLILSERTDTAARAFVRNMIKAQLRYVLVLSPWYGLTSALVCAAYRENVTEFIQIVFFGNGNDIALRWSSTECSLDPNVSVNDLLEKAAPTGVGPHFLINADDDHRINVATGNPGQTQPGSYDLAGDSWTIPGLDMSNFSIPGCVDDPLGLNESEALRGAISKKTHETLKCSDVMSLGHTIYYGYVRDVARYCPASMCLYNRFASACRISKCCVDPNGTMTMPTPLGADPLCVDYKQLPQILAPETQRCEGDTCRPLAFAHSAAYFSLQFLKYAMFGFCPSSKCTRESSILHFLFVAVHNPMTDGVYALVETYQCIERRHGASGLALLAGFNYRDTWMAEELLDCLETEVEFEGVTGRINFRHLHSPMPGYMLTVISQMSVPTNAITFAGVFSADDAVVTNRQFFRTNYTECEPIKGFVAPSRDCPSNLVIELGVSNESDFPLGYPMQCPPGQAPLPFGDGKRIGQVDVFHCRPCASGTYKLQVGDGLCLPCPSGLFSMFGQSNCQICPSNTYSEIPQVTSRQLKDGRMQQFGATNCTPCQPGHVSPPGSSRCAACAVGTSRRASEPDCQLCWVGFYQNSSGSSSCLPCEDILTGSSSARGSSSAGECECAAGTFKRDGVGCVACAEGLVCPGGNDMPLQMAGFFGVVTDASSREISVSRCRNSFECLEAPLGTCASGRQGMACNDCMDSHYRGDDGVCELCTDADKMPFVFILLGLLFCGVSVTIMMKVDLSKQRLSYLTILMTGSQLITALQALGCIRQLSIVWEAPVKTVMDILALMSFDLDMVKAPCLVGNDSTVVKFIMQMLAYPFLFGVLMVAFLISKLTRQPVTMDALYNLNGTILFVLFISLTLAMLMPLQCIDSPNGTSSIASNPGIVCWSSSEHAALAALSILGILIYPVNILCMATWVTLKYPSRIASGAGLTLNIRYRFLFGRYKSERYYFGTIYLLRNLLVALVPVVFSNTPSMQVVSMGSILQVFAAIQAMLWPWRTDGSNLSDVSISLFLVIVLLGAAPLLEVSDPSVLGVLVFVAVMALLAAGLLVMLHALYTRFRPAKSFGIFLCHHKAGAGILSRYIKLVAFKHSSSLLFLDSDELESLDLIFDTVRSATKSLVIILSPELLTRMWCAGEIVTAHRNEIHILPIVCDGFTPPEAAMIESIPSVWSEEQKNTLMSFGITMDMVKEAYYHIMNLHSITMPRFGSAEEQEAVIVEMVACCQLSKRAFADKGKSSTRPRILITGAVADAEALAACRVMQALVQKLTQEETLVVQSAQEAQAVLGSAVYLVVLLSKGMLRVPAFAEILLAVVESEHNVEIVTVSADSGFEFPGPDFYKELEQTGLGEAGLGPEAGPRLSKAFRSLLSVLALPLSPLGSEGLLDKQVSEISRRFRKFKKGASSFTLTTSKSFKDRWGSNKEVFGSEDKNRLEANGEKGEGIPFATKDSKGDADKRVFASL